MKEHTDDSIARMYGITGSQLIISAPSGKVMREQGNILEMADGTLIYVYTVTENPQVTWWIHYSISHINNINSWTYGGKLNTAIMLEDPHLEYYDGLYYLWGEDKDSAEWRHNLHTSPDLINWTNQGTVFEKNPIAGAWDSEAVYSPTIYYIDGNQINLYDGRVMKVVPHVSNLGVATMVGGVWVRHPHNPVMTVAQSGIFDVLSIDAVLKVKDYYVMLQHGLYDYGGAGQAWAAGIATSPNGLTNWTQINSEPIQTPLGHTAHLMGLYTDKWNIFYEDSANGHLYIGTPLSTSDPTPIQLPIIPDPIPIPVPDPEPIPPGLDITLSAAVIASALKNIDNSDDFCDALAKVIVDNLNIQIKPGAIIRQVVGGSYTPAIGYSNTQPIILEVK